MFNPLCTAKVWLPRYVPSLITSRHQKDIDKITVKKAIAKKAYALLKLCIVNTPVVVNTNKAIQVNKGQGEGETK